MWTHLGRHFVMSDMVIGYYNNFIFLGQTPTFVGPTAAEKQLYLEEAQKALPAAIKETKEIRVSFK